MGNDWRSNSLTERRRGAIAVALQKTLEYARQNNTAARHATRALRIKQLYIGNMV